MRRSRLDVALDYGLNKFKVFPCKQNKSPLTNNGFKNATEDLDQILEWWSKYPEALVGLSCGENNLVVIDFDYHKPGLEDCLQEFCGKYGLNFAEHPYTVTSQSGGLHAYFKAPDSVEIPSTTSKLLGGVDTKGHGGYVIAADGIDYILNGDKYGCNPPALNRLPPLPEKVFEPLQETKKQLVVCERSNNFDLDQPTIYRLNSELKLIDPDPYDDWIKVGMALHLASSGSKVGFDVWCEWASKSPKFSIEEHIKKWDSFKCDSVSGVGLGTIFKLAKDKYYSA